LVDYQFADFPIFGRLGDGEIANQVQQQGGVNIPNQAPNVDPNQVRDLAGNKAKPAWSFLLGSLLSLAGAMIGAALGARKPRLYA
jgi:hypothetical protein